MRKVVTLGENSPAFQFYPKDFLTDVKQISMSLAEAGAYWRLCCHCWLEGSLPTDMRRLARLCGATNRQIREMWPAIGHCFIERDGALYHKRLEREREKQKAFSRRQSDNANARWEKERSARTIPEPSGGNATALPDTCSSSSSSSPEREKEALSVSTGDEFTKRVGDLSERYPSIYARVRSGAHYRANPVRDYPNLCELVKGWPDDRLDQMLEVFLQMPAKDANNIPGTPGQFLNMAPHVDKLLRDNGR